MTLSDELIRLDGLRQRGILTDEEFSRAKARLIDAADRPVDDSTLGAINAFRRSRSDRWVAGVCGGLGRATGAEAWVWRLLFAVIFLFGGAGLLLYALLWIFVPSE